MLAELFALTTRHPLREALHGQLMLALYRCGRQAEAQEAFHALRRTLADELAVQPSGEIRDLHRRIIANDPVLEAKTGPQAPWLDAPTDSARPDSDACPTSPGHGQTTEPVLPVIAQLPSAAGDFAGRLAEIEELRAVLVGEDVGPGRTPVAVVTGGGGLGKTSLAVQVAHLVAERFPDGQLFVDLHGLETVPRDSADVLRNWLVGLAQAHR